MQITKPAKITIVAGIVGGMALGYHTTPIHGLVFTGMVFAAAYNINCDITGGCTELAYFLTIIYVIYALAMFGVGHLKKRLVKR
jgi:hypothetical protein